MLLASRARLLKRLFNESISMFFQHLNSLLTQTDDNIKKTAYTSHRLIILSLQNS
jgi:hypothetical protein